MRKLNCFMGFSILTTDRKRKENLEGLFLFLEKRYMLKPITFLTEKGDNDIC